MSVAFGSGPKFGARKVGYTPGSMHKRFRMTNAQKMNRRQVQSRMDQIAMAGAMMFAAKTAEAQKSTLLTLQQVAQTKLTHILDERA